MTRCALLLVLALGCSSKLETVVDAEHEAVRWAAHQGATPTALKCLPTAGLPGVWGCGVVVKVQGAIRGAVLTCTSAGCDFAAGEAWRRAR